jgi:hypothetical protein
VCPALLVSALLAAALPLSLSANDARPAAAAEVTGMRLGRHPGYLRLVIDLTARPAYEARATGANAFVIELPGAFLSPEGHAAMAGDPLAPDLVIRPAASSGPLRFRLISRHAAFIRRSFVLDPPAGGVASDERSWRLVLDIVAKPGAEEPAPGGRAAVIAALPSPHGIDAPPGAAQAPRDDVQAPARPPAREVAVSWARASRILRELQDHRDPAADAPLPPQLVLAPKYRRPQVPLR